MSERVPRQFRTLLTAARAEYAAARYPGDLADELLPSRMRIGFAGRLAWTSVAAAAVAAMVVFAAWLRRPVGHDGTTVTPTNEQWAIATRSTATPFTVDVATDASVEMPLAAAPPAVPSEVTSFVPSYTAVSVQSVPSFPTLDAVIESSQQQQQQQQQQNQTSNSSTTQEAL